MTSPPEAAGDPYRVLVAGGGVAGLETVLALRELAGARVSVTLLAPEPDFVYRPQSVRGLEDVYTAGDAVEYPIKHGGVSAQQGVTAAYGIAARAGAPVLPRTLRPSIRAVLLTGAAPRYLSAQVAGDAGMASRISTTPGWSPPDKIVADHLTDYLAERPRRAPAAAGERR